MAAALCLAAALGAGAARADFRDGLQAYDGGDYATAFRLCRRLAKAGDMNAQVALAGLYRGGIGRDVDLVRAAHWYARAAIAGDAVAQMNLGEMYQFGRGVPRNLVDAFIWYDRAARQGRDWAAKQRDKLAVRMTIDQLELARERLSNPD